MSEHTTYWLPVVTALWAAGCTVSGGAGLDTAGNQSDDSCDAGAHGGDETELDSILAGSFESLPGYAGVGGRAQMVRQASGSTRVEVQLTGLPAGLAMTAHVHAAPCAFQEGGHYKIDPAVMETAEENELWLGLETSIDGIATRSIEFPEFTRGDALSVVLHDPSSGGKMACADLEEDAVDEGVEMVGEFAAFAQAEEDDRRIAGQLGAYRTAEETDVYLELRGLDPAQAYAAHVHALPCAVLDAGGHYKIDPTVVDTLEENEIWPEVSDYESGEMTSVRAFAHAVRADAQSVVLHRIAGDSKPKVACADLARWDHPPLTTAGVSVLLLAGQERTPDLSAFAAMTRSLDGSTEIELVASGLEPGASYPVHVHDLPCAIKDGGAHYLVDPAAGAGEENEIWLPIDGADDEGNAWVGASAEHTARPEAQALVIHDPADGARLACIDLE